MIEADNDPKSPPDGTEPPPKAASMPRRITRWLFHRRRAPDLTRQIEKRAYDLYQQRVRSESQQDQDWLKAERAIRNPKRRRLGIFAVVVLALVLTLLVFGWLFDEAEVRSIFPELLTIAVLLVTVILWKLPKRQAARSLGVNVENRFDRENEARKTLAQIIGGVLLLAGLYSSVRTLDLQREGQVTDRFTKAIDQLGAVQPGEAAGRNGEPRINLEVRLGGIYALERIARDSPKDEWTIMEVLTAYVRENAAKTDEIREPPGEPMLRPRADIQAILTVIGRRDTSSEWPESRFELYKHFYIERPRTLDLRNTELRGADLSAEEFHGANFHAADLRNANLNAASLVGANLGETDLREANIFQANLFAADLSAANLRGADLRIADLQDAKLVKADLTGADFSQTQLNGADFTGAVLRQAYLMLADLRGARLTQNQLNEAQGDSATVLPDGLSRPTSWGK